MSRVQRSPLKANIISIHYFTIIVVIIYKKQTFHCQKMSTRGGEMKYSHTKGLQERCQTGHNFSFFFFWIRDDYIDKMKNTEISKGTKGTNQMVYRRCFQLAIRKEKLQLFKAGISLHQKKKSTTDGGVKNVLISLIFLLEDSSISFDLYLPQNR